MVTQRFLLVSTPKETSRWENFDDDDEAQEVMTWFKGQAADFYDSGIQKLVPRLNKCLDNAGDYVEKYSYVQAIHWQCRFCKLKMLYMFKTFVSLVSGHASYIRICAQNVVGWYKIRLRWCRTGTSDAGGVVLWVFFFYNAGEFYSTYKHFVQAALTARNLEPDQWRSREEWRLVSGRRRQLL